MIQKATCTTLDKKLQIGVPFAKVNEEKRTVSGFATLDNVDRTGDVVTAEASRKAFNNFRGNVREQHLPIAAGKVVNFRSDIFFDSDSERMYEGIYVEVYVSKGAQDTWEKVLDGTLSGFSIGGNINNYSDAYIDTEGRVIRFITDYDLVELSLVDSPANHLCNVFSVIKSEDGIKVEGFAAENKVETIFWCDADNIAIASTQEELNCSACNKDMSNIGWFESVEGEDRTVKVREAIKAYTARVHDMKGGSKMAEEVKTEEVTEVTKSEEASEIRVEKETDVENLSKALEEIQNSLSKYHKDGSDRDAAISAVKETVQGVEKALQEKLDELLTKHQELDGQFKEFKTNFSNLSQEVEKRLGVVENTATKKSLEKEEEKVVRKSNAWSGAFLPSPNDL